MTVSVHRHDRTRDDGAASANTVPQAGALRSLRDYAALASVLLRCYARYFKANPFLSWVPVDLTSAGAALALAGMAAVLVGGGIVPSGTLAGHAPGQRQVPLWSRA